MDASSLQGIHDGGFQLEGGFDTNQGAKQKVFEPLSSAG